MAQSDELPRSHNSLRPRRHSYADKMRDRSRRNGIGTGAIRSIHGVSTQGQRQRERVRQLLDPVSWVRAKSCFVLTRWLPDVAAPQLRSR